VSSREAFYRVLTLVGFNRPEPSISVKHVGQCDLMPVRNLEGPSCSSTHLGLLTLVGV